jgi:glutamate/tyrosine decarboxylase-like PLP-dependent enzyme
VIEEVCGAWLIDLFGLPRHTSYALVTGCQMANFTALATARHSVLEAAGWDVETDGPGRARRRSASSSARSGMSP